MYVHAEAYELRGSADELEVVVLLKRGDDRGFREFRSAREDQDVVHVDDDNDAGVRVDGVGARGIIIIVSVSVDKDARVGDSWL